jgi:hypothetical protein
MKHSLSFGGVAVLLTACATPAAATLVPAGAHIATSAPTLELSEGSQVSDYAFPKSIDPESRYLFYLHGQIIEDQGLAAFSPVFGPYEYLSILEALASHGFVVISELRPGGTDANAYAQEVLSQIRLLLHAGVPPGSITVVGASKGAYIAATVSHLLDDPELNYVLLGTCHPSMVADWQSRQMSLHGNVLAIRDSADELAGSCQELFDLSKGKGLGRYREIVLEVGTGHGILYKPLDEWIIPTVAWAGR